MKNVVCRLPYSLRVPMWLVTVLVVFLIERMVKLSKMVLIVGGIGTILFYFWMALTANTLFFLFQ